MKTEWERNVRNIFEKIQTHKKPYLCSIDGLEIVVHPAVFSPKYFTDSAWFANAIPEIVGHGSLLEIGTGTGIIAFFAELGGADPIVATDISLAAVENARVNFHKYGCQIRLLLGDLYTPLDPTDKFDFIFWNHPFNKGDNTFERTLLRSGFDHQYKSLDRYIREADNHLTAKGRLLLGTGNHPHFEDIRELARKHRYRLEILKKQEVKLSEETGFVIEYRLCELVRRSRL